MSRARRTTDKAADLIECETAPQMGDNCLALLDRQPAKSFRRRLGVERAVLVRLKQWLRLAGCAPLVAAPALGGPSSGQGAIAHCPKDPGEQLVRRLLQ